MSCPNCGSNNWKHATHVHKEGLSQGQTKGKIKGISVGTGGVGIGLGSTKQDSVFQTDLSKAAAPPTTNRETFSAIATFLGLVIPPVLFFYIYGFNFATFIIFLLCLAPFVWVVILIVSMIGVLIPLGEDDKLRMKIYNHTKMCTRCGNFYVDWDSYEESLIQN